MGKRGRVDILIARDIFGGKRRQSSADGDGPERRLSSYGLAQVTMKKASEESTEKEMKIIKTLSVGAYFGEGSLVTTTFICRASIRAVDFVDVLQLEKASL